MFATISIHHWVCSLLSESLSSSDVNDWLERYLQIIEARGLSYDSDAIANDCEEAIEYVTRRMRKFEMMTRSLDLEITTTGEKWVDSGVNF